MRFQGHQEICDWLLVRIFLYNISNNIEQKNTIGIFYTIFCIILSRKIQFVFFYPIFCILGAMINHSLYTDQTTPNTLCTILFINFRLIFIHISMCTQKWPILEKEIPA